MILQHFRYLFYAAAAIFFTFGLLIGIEVGTESAPKDRECNVFKQPNTEAAINPAGNGYSQWNSGGISFSYPSAWSISNGYSASGGSTITLSNREIKENDTIDILISHFSLNGSVSDWLDRKGLSFEPSSLAGYDGFKVANLPGYSSIDSSAYYIPIKDTVWEVSVISKNVRLMASFNDLVSSIRFSS